MAIAQTQKKNGTSVIGTNYDLIYTSTPTQNNLLIGVWNAGGSADPGTVTQPSGWTLATGFPFQRGALYKLVIAYKVAGAGESTTVRLTTGNSVGNIGTIFEYSGLATSSPEDKTQTSDGGVGSITTLTSGTTAATTLADELVIAGWALLNGSGGTESVTNGFTLENTSGTRNICASKIVSAAGAQETTASWLTARTAVGGIVTFKSPSTTNKSLSVTQTQTATLTRSVGKLAAVTQTQTPTVGRSVGKTATATQTQTPALIRSTGKTVTTTQTQTASLSRSVGKILAVTQTATATVAKVVGKILAFVQTQLGSLTATKQGVPRNIDYDLGRPLTSWRADEPETGWTWVSERPVISWRSGAPEA